MQKKYESNINIKQQENGTNTKHSRNECRRVKQRIVMTFRRGSDIHFVRAGESTIKHSIGYTFLTFFFGWWGFPWGPIYTIGSIFTNLTGGKDVTQEIIYSLNVEQPTSSVTNAKTGLSLSENDTRETEEELLKRRAEKEDHSRFMPQ
jgi:hypothetical protein